jgi:5-methylcytosine-specific restriction endonuclease McrA
MGRGNENRKRHKETDHTFWELPPSDIEREKTRARELRHTSWWRQKVSRGLCHYCGRKFRIDELTMDHIIPLSRGGRSEKINIVPSCKECNNQKRYLLPSEWDEYLHRIKGDMTPDSEVLNESE